MKRTIINIWPLLLGVTLIASNTGIQGTLLGVRANIEGFSTTSIGLVMTSYYIGYVFGSTLGQRMITNVGHVRTFGALTALASITILLHSVFLSVWLWFLLRFLTGYATSGIYLVSESWLNQSVDDSIRGRVLSIYSIMTFIGIFGGQFLLNLAPPDSFQLYILLSVLLSFAAIPMLVASTHCPVVERSNSISIRKLFGWEPYGLIIAFLINMGFAIVFGLGAVYAQKLGMSIREISWFIAAYILGGIVFQWPLGKLSDKYDRRIVVILSACIATCLAVISSFFTINEYYSLLISFAMLGGFMLPLYSLAVALVNDSLRPEMVVAASGTFILVAGIGASIGPVIVALIMDFIGYGGFFWCVAVISGIISVIGIYLMTVSSDNQQYQKHEFSIYSPIPIIHSEPNLNQKSTNE